MAYLPLVNGQWPITGLTNTPVEKAYFYHRVNPVGIWPLTLEEVRIHLRIDADNSYENTYLQLCIQIATEFAEKYTGKDFIKKEYLTYRDYLCSPIILQKSPFPIDTPLILFQYLTNGVWTNVPSNLYYIQYLNTFSTIEGYPYGSFQLTTDPVLQAVKIKFIAGYSDTSAGVPADIKMGMLNHIAAIYENRGDADTSSEMFSNNFPVQTKIIYDQYRIIETH